LFAVLALVLTLFGLWIGFAVAPADAQQGEGYRIIFVHVPVSWMSMIIYLAMAFWSVLGLTFNTRLSGMMTRALAPTGAMFAFLSLWTGALWGKPMWGTWWVWDARLTSVLVLFVIYLGLIALWQTIEDASRAARGAAILTLVGVVNLPIIKFSVDWWNTLHQPASVFRMSGPTIAPSMLWPLLVMAVAFTLLFTTLHLMATRNEILRRRARRLAIQAASGETDAQPTHRLTMTGGAP
jgi:heme exporter protein C